MQITFFEDDTSILKAGPRNQCELQLNLYRTNNWFSCHKMSLKFQNCEVMNVGIGTPGELALKNKKLDELNTCNYFGVYLNKKLL